MRAAPFAALIIACTLVAHRAASAQPAAALPPNELPGLHYDTPFFPGAAYNADVPTPDSVLGYVVGSKPAMHAEIEAVIKAIAAKSSRVKLFEYGKTHEGRMLYYLAISSEANINRLDQLKSDYAKLADPRSVSAGEGDRLAGSLPAAAWMGYAIHGDEMSGSDAALAVIHHLAACTDQPVVKMLNELVVLIDPLMNPDGRDRYIRGINENRTTQPNVDDQSLLHSGVWPYGRTNHYLFDMNRDWIFGSQPESRGRIEAAGQWHPHYFMESHEMGSQDTFLFQPPREPINPNIPDNVRKWLPVFGKDQGAAFDRMGWRYYTGEWNEEWYPGYSGAWGALRGAVENLYEQASIATDAVRRAEGTLETYREAVHHQLVSTMANLTTLAANRQAVLRDYLAERRKNVAADGRYAKRSFAIVPSTNHGRLNAFTNLMSLQGFEMHVAQGEFTAAARDRLGRVSKNQKFPAGTILIPNRQPEANLISAMLEFDPRMNDSFLDVERRELLRFNQSKLYDVTAWNITMMFDVEAYELITAPPEGAPKFDPHANIQPIVAELDSTIGYIIDGADDRSVVAAGRLMEQDIRVRVANKPIQFDGKDYARGSVIVALVDNRGFAGDVAATAARTADELGVGLAAIGSGMGEGDLPDLGGEHFVLLHQPRIAVMGREGFNAYSFGEIWHVIDHVLNLRASFLDANQFNAMDLRRYNVLVLPDATGGGAVLKEKLQPIKEWVQAGGTLIAIGTSAATLAKAESGIGSARTLPDVMEQLDEYRQQIVREWEGRNAEVDPAQVWSAAPPQHVRYPWLIGEAGEKPGAHEMKRRDEWRRIFMPQGAILAARIDDRHWLTAGCRDDLPVLYGGGVVLMAKDSTQAPIRLGALLQELPAPALETTATLPQPSTATAPATAPAGAPADLVKSTAFAPPGYELRLRMSGLLWPEAADRLAHAAYLTREQVGAGQVILFAANPTFRAGALGTRRVFSNALVFGPGMGANQPIRP